MGQQKQLRKARRRTAQPLEQYRFTKSCAAQRLDQLFVDVLQVYPLLSHDLLVDTHSVPAREKGLYP